MLNNSPTPSQDDKRGEDAEGFPSSVNFVTKHTFRSQSNAPVTQATVEDLWRRALKQEADFRTRYWAMIAGVVIVSVVAILAVVAPLAAQRDSFKEFETRMANVERKTEPLNKPTNKLLGRKAPDVNEEYLSAMQSSQDCSFKQPLSPESLGPLWTCAARDWEQWDASNGTLVTYLCSKSSVCSVLLTGKCSTNQWVYTNIKMEANCDCTRKKPNVLALSSKRRKARKAGAVKKEKISLTKDGNWKLEHCNSDPPTNWGCAVSDWSSKSNHLGYNPKAKGYLVNYACRSQTRGCTVTRTLECGESGTWKVVFTSSIVNDCRLPTIYCTNGGKFKSCVNFGTSFICRK